jgi:hypothetical protein
MDAMAYFYMHLDFNINDLKCFTYFNLQLVYHCTSFQLKTCMVLNNSETVILTISF